MSSLPKKMCIRDRDRILAVQTCEDGYDYTLLDENYNEIDGGQVDNPELSMLCLLYTSKKRQTNWLLKRQSRS